MDIVLTWKGDKPVGLKSFAKEGQVFALPFRSVVGIVGVQLEPVVFGDNDDFTCLTIEKGVYSFTEALQGICNLVQ